MKKDLISLENNDPLKNKSMKANEDEGDDNAEDEADEWYIFKDL